MRRGRKIRIVATLGPASAAPGRIGELFQAGVDVFRINMSHNDHASLARLHGELRALAADQKYPVGILVDLQGPKIRLGTLGGARLLKAGERVTLTCAAHSDTDIPIPHPEIFAASGDTLLIDDGKLRLKLLEKTAGSASAIVETGGEISDHKGVTMPGAVLGLSALTAKDRADLEAALALGVDWIALSFVQRPEDVAELKALVAGRAGILAKIEKPAAMMHLEQIVAQSDALMVARGDLGVEAPLESVPVLQKQIIRAARAAGKPVVVATQMMESMITAPTPTRAEVSDIAGAVYDGADAVMLSAESAVGAHPVEAVAMMDRIAMAVEQDPAYPQMLAAQRPPPAATTAGAIMASVQDIAATLEARAILCWTKSGATALRAARERPLPPILALTSLPQTAQRLTLVWGLTCIVADEVQDLDDLVERALAITRREGFAKDGDKVIITGGVPLGTVGATNLLRIATVK